MKMTWFRIGVWPLIRSVLHRRVLHRRLSSISVLVCLLHLAALLCIARIDLTSPKSNEAVQFESAPPFVPLAKQEYQVHLERMKQSSALPKLPPLAVSALSDISIPQVDMPHFDSHALGEDWSRGGISSGFKFEEIAVSLELPNPPLFFGQKIQAQQLGVIWDVSRSMHRYLARVEAEVNHQFPQATLVLTSGSGIHASMATEIFPLKRRSALEGSKVEKHFSSSDLSQAQDIFDGLRQRANTYFAKAKLDQACAAAFEQLIDKDVDAIYWFGDFQDPIDPKQLEQISLLLQEKQIPVYLHHPQGQIRGPATRARVEEINRILLLPTGGSLITERL